MAVLLADERRMKLAQLIKDNGSVRVAEVAEFFGVTRETIRKDLIYLDSQRLVCKTHGGAVSLSESAERPLQIRVTENAAQKERIALKALDFLQNKHVAIFDSGSTVLMAAQYLPENTDISIVTNSFSAAQLLAEKGLSFTLIGGEFSPITMATSGMLATHTLNMLKADVVFLGTSGFQATSGPTAKAFCDAQIKQDMMRNSAYKIVLADSSKFESNAFVQYASWSDIDLLITNEEVSPEALKAIRQKVEVLLA